MNRVGLAGRCGLLLAVPIHGHGHMTLPPSRNGGTLELAGNCSQGECLWFEMPATISVEPTNNDPDFRTWNVDVQSGPDDWARERPWRAPGQAAINSSGCGLA